MSEHRSWKNAPPPGEPPASAANTSGHGRAQQPWTGQPAQQRPQHSFPPSHDHGPAPRPQPVVLPDWLLEDWRTGFQLAGASFATWFVGALVIVLAAMSVSALQFGFSAVNWEGLLGSLLGLPLVYLGGVKGVPVLLTGLAACYLSFRVATRVPGPLQAFSPGALAALAVKAAVGFTVIVIFAAIIVDALDLGITVAPGGGALYSGLGIADGFNYVAIVFLLFPIAIVTALFALLRASGRTVRWLAGIDDTPVPGMLATSWAGVRRGLLVGAALWLIWVLGSVLQFATDDFGGLGDLGAALVFFVVMAGVAAAVDVAALGMVGAMSFLAEGGLLFGDFSGNVPGWAWLMLPAVAALFITAGYRAAEAARPRSQAEAIKASVLVGPLMAALGAVVAITWHSEFEQFSLAPRAILLPLLWGVLALGGAWLFAARRNLPSGVVRASAAGGSVSAQSPPEDYESAPSSTAGQPAHAPEPAGTDRWSEAPSQRQQPVGPWHEPSQPPTQSPPEGWPPPDSQR